MRDPVTIPEKNLRAVRFISPPFFTFTLSAVLWTEPFSLALMARLFTVHSRVRNENKKLVLQISGSFEDSVIPRPYRRLLRHTPFMDCRRNGRRGRRQTAENLRKAELQEDRARQLSDRLSRRFSGSRSLYGAVRIDPVNHEASPGRRCGKTLFSRLRGAAFL